MKRTAFLGALGAVAALGATGARARAYTVTHSDAQWRRILGDRYYILRENGTEPAFSSPLIAEKRTGTYRCAGCATTLFNSEMKYDSGDGWPSFFTVRPHVTRTRADFELPGEPRTEVHCATCGGHLGHIFDDGPAPTHLRYCIDGLALVFVPSNALK
ncbi:MAG: peptide-methionine (R)-S-oxide reductase MsrB [bacterium]|nr:peptide-methionine (R)-S-oxide reductase MsrB [bacterium]